MESTKVEGTAAFERDVLAYQQDLPRLLAEHQQGKVALLCGGAVIALFETHDAAMAAGYERFGGTPFLVKLISSADLGLERWLEPCPT